MHSGPLGIYTYNIFIYYKYLFGGDQFAELGHHVVSGDDALLDGDDDVAGFLEHSLALIRNNLRA